MNKRYVAAVLIVIILSTFASCVQPDSEDAATTPELKTDSVLAEVKPESEAADSKKTVIGIKTVNYPVPNVVAAYTSLTDNQKKVYDAMGNALSGALNGSFVVGETYSLDCRVTWYDFKLVHSIMCANFSALENILICFTSADSKGTQEYADRIFFLDDGIVTDFILTKYPALCGISDSVLSELHHDGTDYGKAFAIARWLCDNVVYPGDYPERGADIWLSEAYGALVKREAICTGYSQAFDFLCKKAGLETIYVTGTSRDNGHAWNMICIDGKWYNVDTTWMRQDDYFEYFMIDDGRFSLSHENAVYYRVPDTLEIVIPKADTFCTYKFVYNKTLFNSVSDALSAANLFPLNEKTQICFTTSDEKELFLKCDYKYFPEIKKYIHTEDGIYNTVNITFQAEKYNKLG